jgi:hypothetical protein
MRLNFRGVESTVTNKYLGSEKREPIEGFEPPCVLRHPDYKSGAIDQLCDIGMERDRLFIPLWDSLRPFVRKDGFEPPTCFA